MCSYFINQSLTQYMCAYTHTHIHDGILLIHKKEWNNASGSNIDGPRDYHIEWS